MNKIYLFLSVTLISCQIFAAINQDIENEIVRKIDSRNAQLASCIRKVAARKNITTLSNIQCPSGKPAQI